MNQPSSTLPETGAPVAETVAETANVPVQGPSAVVRLLRVLKREPVLFITLAYIFVSFLGLWSSYWFYRRFDLPILEYMQSSDFFVAGLRRPEFVLVLGYVLVVMWFSTWPLRWNEKNPERAQKYRDERWWGKWLFPHRNSWQNLWGLSSETLMVLGFLFMLVWMLFNLTSSRAERVYRGAAGDKVRVTLASNDVLPGDVRLLGTNSAYVFLWSPEARKNQVVPVESILRIEFLKSPPKPGKSVVPAR